MNEGGDLIPCRVVYGPSTTDLYQYKVVNGKKIPIDEFDVSFVIWHCIFDFVHSSLFSMFHCVCCCRDDVDLLSYMVIHHISYFVIYICHYLFVIY